MQSYTRRGLWEQLLTVSGLPQGTKRAHDGASDDAPAAKWGRYSEEPAWYTRCSCSLLLPLILRAPPAPVVTGS